MKKYISMTILIILILIIPFIGNAWNKWYENGSLHNATVGEWNKATYENKLATAADWAVVTYKIEKIVQNSGSIDTLKPFAIELVSCINKVTLGEVVHDSMKVVEVATGCSVLMGWFEK